MTKPMTPIAKMVQKLKACEAKLQEIQREEKHGRRSRHVREAMMALRTAIALLRDPSE